MPDHLGITSTSSRIAIITGNPDRVPTISGYFERHRELSAMRGFICYEAYLDTTPLLVVAAGVGAPSTAIVVEELIDLGVTAIIRIGTCGALQSTIEVGDLVIPTGCVREEGTTLQYVDATFPAIPDQIVLNELIAEASREETRYHVGITHCKDAYYLEWPGKQVNPKRTGQQWELWRKIGVLATEMETSTLFVLGSLRGIRTGALFINVGKITDPNLFSISLASAVRITQRVVATLVEKDLLATATPRSSDDLSYLTKDFKTED